MIRLDCDYMEGAHPKVLQKLIETNEVSTPGYGNDAFTAAAKDKVRLACGCPDADVYFLVGGTQTNATVIDALLARHEGVIAAESGHINVHESGAIEATGHKVLVLPQHEGKLKAEEVEKFIDDFYADETYEHMVAPGMVYISNPTEYGTVYTLEELADLSTVCEQAGIPLYMDGARLAYALAAEGNDVTLNDVARLCDIFYIGGTKVGALFGEAVVIMNPALQKDFRYFIKQNGGMLAKGWLLGLQFATLFENDLYFSMTKQAVADAMRIRDAFRAKGIPFYMESPTNQQFFVLPNDALAKLYEKYAFSPMGVPGETESEIRICTSWATTEENVDFARKLCVQKDENDKDLFRVKSYIPAIIEEVNAESLDLAEKLCFGTDKYGHILFPYENHVSPILKFFSKEKQAFIENLCYGKDKFGRDLFDNKYSIYDVVSSTKKENLSYIIFYAKICNCHRKERKRLCFLF